MASKNNTNVCVVYIMGICAAIAFSNCTPTPQKEFSRYNFSLKDTLSIFLLNNEKGNFFCIPIQYSGDYQIARFEFDNGDIQIGDYTIPLKRDELTISVYLNEKADESGNTAGEFNLIYLEKNGRVSDSKIAEPLAPKDEPDDMVNHYYIIIEKYLADNEMKNIIAEYEKGNVSSRFSVWYDITIDNEEQNGSGLLDNFELYTGPALDPAWFPPNLDFFKEKYL